MTLKQVHYNLAWSDKRGLSDQTNLRLRVAPHVESLGFFALLDPMLDSASGDEPVTLPARQKSTAYLRTLTGEQIRIAADTRLSISGIMPHMHQLGQTYQLSLGKRDEAPLCAAEIADWDFHWQRLYFPREPLPLTAESVLNVSCGYDTSSVNAPVLPGWGTQNEMCTAVLCLTLPLPAELR